MSSLYRTDERFKSKGMIKDEEDNMDSGGVKSLYEQLQEQKEREEKEFTEKYSLSARVGRMSEEDAEYVEKLEQKRREEIQEEKTRDQKEREEFRKLKEEQNKEGVTSIPLKSKAKNDILNFGNTSTTKRMDAKSTLKGLVKKRKVDK